MHDDVGLGRVCVSLRPAARRWERLPQSRSAHFRTRLYWNFPAELPFSFFSFDLFFFFFGRKEKMGVGGCSTLGWFPWIKDGEFIIHLVSTSSLECRYCVHHFVFKKRVLERLNEGNALSVSKIKHFLSLSLSCCLMCFFFLFYYRDECPMKKKCQCMWDLSLCVWH